MNTINQADSKEMNSEKGKQENKCTEHYQKIQKWVSVVAISQ